MKKLWRTFVDELRTDWQILMTGSRWQKAIGTTGFIIFWLPGGLLVITPVYLVYKATIYIKRR